MKQNETFITSLAAAWVPGTGCIASNYNLKPFILLSNAGRGVILAEATLWWLFKLHKKKQSEHTREAVTVLSLNYLEQKCSVGECLRTIWCRNSPTETPENVHKSKSGRVLRLVQMHCGAEEEEEKKKCATWCCYSIQTERTARCG